MGRSSEAIDRKKNVRDGPTDGPMDRPTDRLAEQNKKNDVLIKKKCIGEFQRVQTELRGVESHSTRLKNIILVSFKEFKLSYLKITIYPFIHFMISITANEVD